MLPSARVLAGLVVAACDEMQRAKIPVRAPAAVGLLLALAGCDCVQAYRVSPTIHGFIAVDHASGDQVRAPITDANETYGGAACSLGHEIVYRHLTPEPLVSVQLNVGCDDGVGVGALPFTMGNDAATFNLLDLNTASAGEVRSIPATLMQAHLVEAVLVVTRAEGEYRTAPDGPTDDYLREFTLTASFDCATAPNANCDYRVEVALEGRQTAEDFIGQCGISPDE